MVLSIDLTRRIVSQPARFALVDAIVTAPAYEPETDYIEWKGPLDVHERRADLATHILGFANREVGSAARHFEGTAYLVIGAEPGQAAGVSPVDPALLNDWLAPYVGGQAGPQWDAHYVDYSGVQVLLISVDAPRDGDRAWPVRRQFNAQVAAGRHIVIREGAIYIRRHGQTVEANAAELDMLDGRARFAASRTNVIVQSKSGAAALLRAVDRSVEAAEPYVARQRKKLMRALEHAQAKSEKGVPANRPTTLQQMMGLGLAGQGVTEKETRTAEQYIAEVDDYCDQLRELLPTHLATIALGRRLAVLQLEARNLTDNNFHNLQVVISVSGSVGGGMWEIPMSPGLPSSPRPYGPRVVTYGSLLGRLGAPMPDLLNVKTPTMPDVIRRGRIRRTNSIEVEFLTFDLRPGQTERLEELHLVIPSADAGKVLDVTWQATATNAPGVSSGSFGIQVSPDIALPAELLTPIAGDEDDDGSEPQETDLSE
jgi:hypothetical protein